MTKQVNRESVLIIRADANSRIGTGHVMRCIALGQAWKRRAEGGDLKPEGETAGAVEIAMDAGRDTLENVSGLRSHPSSFSSVIFICAEISDVLAERLKSEEFSLVHIDAEPGSSEDVQQTLDVLSGLPLPVVDAVAIAPASLRVKSHPSSFPSFWLVLDGYQFSIEDQRTIRAAGHKLLVIDDCNHLPEYECDILLNQNINAGELDYNINPDARLLLGTDYILLRREFFRGLEEFKRGFPRVGKTPETGMSVLVTMGGADPDNVTLKVIQALQQLDRPDLHAKIVVGPANPHQSSLDVAIQHSTFNIQLIRSANMAELMRWADFAISAAGSTCWELLSMGVPFATVILADNQEGVASYLEQHAGVPCLGWGSENIAQRIIECLDSPENFTQDRSVRLVDGLGAGRVVERLHEYQGCSRDP